MKKLKGYIACITAALIVFALVYPFFHVFSHHFSKNDIAEAQHSSVVKVEKHIVHSNIDCKICDFHFSNSSAPEFISYKLHLPQKESVYSLSLTQTVLEFQVPFFSLRAPPQIHA